MSAGNEDIGRLLLRITCGGLLLMHGSHTLFNGLDHIRRFLSQSGLPEVLAYGNIVGEVIAPVFMIAGYKARLAALVVAFNMLLSVLLAHRDIVFQRNDFGGWMIELNVFFLVTAVVVVLIGPGQISVRR
ncbi:MAG TPA: DoxX family protein [Chryseosolibacter sp.]|nr:DoxX family protein [Chryseosolibacter sp.]